MTSMQTYIVCATMRSGSSLLCNLLQKTRCAGEPREFLRDYLRGDIQISDSEYIEFVEQKMLGSASSNGVSGVKLMWWNIDLLLKRLRNAASPSEALTERELLGQVFPNTKFIFITRRNKLAQAISLCRAERTKTWTKNRNEIKDFSLPRITNFHIDRNLKLIESWESAWQEFFRKNSIDVYTVVYEDLISDYRTNLSGVLKFLGILEQIDKIPVPDLEKQADFYSYILVTQYRLYLALIGILPSSFICWLRDFKLKIKRVIPSG
ncbi:MAG: Stf0 sulfotransferase family protein [Elainella sp. Prado103]|jgi:LPS sulfotransferase NodH|nr:Stf0 sulfotransferase family protein [Elainella sp. Prado103]